MNNEIEMEIINDDKDIDLEITTEGGTKNYNKLSNKPQINGVELVGNKTTEDLGIDQDFVKDNNYVHTDNNYTTNEKTKLASLENYDDTDIKADISDLETNKADKSTTYTKTEVDNLIPDVSNFITKTVDDLVNYYKKTETYTRTEVNNLIGAIQQFHYEIVQTLPATGENNILYLVPRSESEESNIYDEYVYANNNWEKIGSTDIDLSGYVTTADLNTELSNYTTTTDLETLLTDYVKFTDYGNNTDTTGVSRGGNYGWRISGAGVGYTQKASDTQVVAKENAYCPIVPSNLDLAVKTSISTNEISLTDEEKNEAHSWLGIEDVVADAKGNNIKLTDSRAKKIPSLTLFGKSSQNVNTGSNLTYMTNSNYIVKNAYAQFGNNVIIEDNGSSIYFPTGSVLSNANTRFLVYLLPTTANKWYTFQVEADPETSDIGVTFADYQPNPSSTSDRISALVAGKNISYTFQAQGDRVYCIEFRSPTNAEGAITNNPTRVKVMFNEGVPKNWEPYTNGVATPTMTTPSAITDITTENITITDGVNSQTTTLNLELGNVGNTYDTIEKYEDGTGKLIKRTYRQTLPNLFTKSSSSGNFLLTVSNLDYVPKLPSSGIDNNGICNQFTNKDVWLASNGYVVVSGTAVSFTTANEFNEYFAEHPLVYEYVLDTPIETDLTEEQLQQLDLATYNGETTITSNTDLEIKYVANAKKYVDNKIEQELKDRDKYVLLAEKTIVEPVNTAIEWESSSEEDVYDDIIVSCENMLGDGAGTGAVAYRLSNSSDNFTVSQSNLVSNTTARTYWADLIRYLPNKWKFEKRGATNAVGDVTGNAVRVDTQYKDKINRVRFYAGSSINFVQGTYRIYGRKRF